MTTTTRTRPDAAVQIVADALRAGLPYWHVTNDPNAPHASLPTAVVRQPVLTPDCPPGAVVDIWVVIPHDPNPAQAIGQVESHLAAVLDAIEQHSNLRWHPVSSGQLEDAYGWRITAVVVKEG